METITETIITESTMIGHNPKTPGGVGLAWASPSPRALAARRTLPISWWSSSAFDFADIARLSTRQSAPDQITGVILQKGRRRAGQQPAGKTAAGGR
ncbi:hypothetical protein [Acinetobacter baumannii]|uniref:hypothetical protein n=1 Tax=Acinetobacter baumannii TaxID=470 RepID=UPI003D2FEDE6